MEKEWSTLRKLIWLRGKILGGLAFVWTVVAKAASPLSLTNAIEKPLKSLKQTSYCTLSGTQGTPTNPVDILCNNGTLQMAHRSGLPSGYKLLDCVGSNGAPYIITDVYLASTDVIESEFRNSSTTGYGAIYGIYKSGESSALYGNQTYYGYDEPNAKVDTGVVVDTEWHSARHDFVHGTLTIDDTTVHFTPWTFTNTTKNAVLARYYNGSYGYIWKGYIRKFKVTRGNEVVCDLIPAKDGEGVAGLYDLISGSFYTATGGTLIEGNVVDDYELAVIGTKEVITLGEQTATVVDLFGLKGTSSYRDVQDIITGAITRKTVVYAFNGTEDYREATSFGGVVYIPVFANALNSRNTAQQMCTHFWGLGRKTSGTASEGQMFWDSSYNLCFRTSKTATEFKAWIAEQYAKGNPVIAVFGKTASDESVEPQVLTTSMGDNTLSWTAGGGVSMRAEYAQAQ